MLAKVLLITFIAVASCQEHGYSLKTHHEPTRQHYEHQPIRVQEEHEAEQQPQYTNSEGHGQAYSSQSVIYNAGGHGGGYASQNEHVAPVYQYSSEEEGQNNQEQPTHYETPVHQKIPATRYQTIHLTPALSHNEIQAHPQIDEHQTQYFQAHEAVGYQQDSEQNAAPIQHVDPVHRVRPVQYSAPAYHAVSEHHAASIPHATLDNHISSVHHANAIPVQHAEVHAQDSHEEPVDYYAYPKYQYEYKVEDPHTGDNKFQHEFRDGDVVKGIYGLHEADGSIRVVEYSSDKHNGFNAVVKHMAPGQHVQIKTHHQN